jgi:3',5'-cyclic AMP phosphodiesterase CpdA
MSVFLTKFLRNMNSILCVEHNTSRRDLLKVLGALGIAGSLPALSQALQPTKKSLRLAYMTDMHIVSGGRGSDAGIAMTLAHLQKNEKPELILTGGDNLTGTMGQELASAIGMRDRWIKAFRDAHKIPMIHCIGNHDVWGWNKQTSKATGNEALYGKNWSKEQFQMDKLYYSVERGGWKIIVLDTVREFENRYQGGLDDAQFEWLTGEVKTKLPTLVLCHIPVTGISPLLVGAGRLETDFNVPFGSCFRDQHRVVKLFDENKNVKLVLGGHTHFEEELTFNGITYYNGGAVSGAWWRTVEADLERRDKTDGIPRLTRSRNSYSMIDLNADGTFKIDRKLTNWKPQSAS